MSLFFFVLPIALGVHHVDSVCRRHEVRPGRARTTATVQVFRLHESSFQSQMALQSLRQGLATVQGSRTRISRVKK